MNTKTWLSAACIAICLIVAACTGKSAPSVQPITEEVVTGSQATNPPSPVVETAVILPSTTPTPQLEILYQDDFSDVNSGWESYRSADGMLDYDNGKYRMQMPVPKNTYWVAANVDFADVIVEADAVRNSGPLDNVYGLMCRLNYATNEAYMFLVTSKGYYGIAKWTNLELVLLDNSDYVFSDAIFTNERENHLRAECVGDHLSLSVNGQLLLEVQDDTYTTGNIGLVAGTTGEPGTDISFDNLVVYAP